MSYVMTKVGAWQDGVDRRQAGKQYESGSASVLTLAGGVVPSVTSKDACRSRIGTKLNSVSAKMTPRSSSASTALVLPACCIGDVEPPRKLPLGLRKFSVVLESLRGVPVLGRSRGISLRSALRVGRSPAPYGGSRNESCKATWMAVSALGLDELSQRVVHPTRSNQQQRRGTGHSQTFTAQRRNSRATPAARRGWAVRRHCGESPPVVP